MNEPWKYDAMYKKPDTKCHMVFDSIYMKYSEQKNSEKQKAE